MKPEAKRSATERRRSNDEDGAFNLASMKHAIDSIDSGKGKDNKTFNLSSLAVALSVASRQMKRKEVITQAQGARHNYEKRKSEAENYEEKRKTNKKRARRLRKKVMIGVKPDTNLEMQRWFSNFDESFRRSLFQNRHKPMPYQVPPPPPKPKPKPKEESQQQQHHLCGFNTECSDAFF